MFNILHSGLLQTGLCHVCCQKMTAERWLVRDSNSNSKTLILKDSSVRSIWTYLISINIHVLILTTATRCCCRVFVDSEIGNIQLMKRLSQVASPTGWGLELKQLTKWRAALPNSGHNSQLTEGRGALPNSWQLTEWRGALSNSWQKRLPLYQTADRYLIEGRGALSNSWQTADRRAWRFIKQLIEGRDALPNSWQTADRRAWNFTKQLTEGRGALPNSWQTADRRAWRFTKQLTEGRGALSNSWQTAHRRTWRFAKQLTQNHWFIKELTDLASKWQNSLAVTQV